MSQELADTSSTSSMTIDDDGWFDILVGSDQRSSVPAAHAPYPSVSKENIQTSRAWQPSNIYALLLS